MNREDALKIYSEPVTDSNELTAYFIRRMNITEETYNNIISGDKKTYKDFKTYKKRFETLRPLFYLMAKAQLIPLSFYIKYTSKTEGAWLPLLIMALAMLLQ